MSRERTRLGSTIELVPVARVVAERYAGEGALLVLQDGSFRMIIRTGAVNFDMKVSDERAGIVSVFGSLLNSLEPSFPIQIVVHSKQLDTDAYARQFRRFTSNEKMHPRLRELCQNHLAYFDDTVKQQNLLNREFYVVLPLKGVGPVTQTVSDQIPFAGLVKALFGSAEKRIMRREVDPGEIAAARDKLSVRADEVCSRLSAAGIPAHRLGYDEVTQLLYESYHPGLSERQRRGPARA